MFVLEVVITAIWLCALVGGFAALVRFLSLYLSDRSFEKVGRLTTGVKVDEKVHPGDKDSIGWTDHIIEYFDTFQNKAVHRADPNPLRIRYPAVGESFIVQYTESKVRIYDKRYLDVKAYSGKKSGITVLICAVVFLISCVLLPIIIMSHPGIK